MKTNELLQSEELKTIRGKPIKVPISTRLPILLSRKLIEMAHENNTNVAVLLESWIMEKIENYENGKVND